MVSPLSQLDRFQFVSRYKNLPDISAFYDTSILMFSVRNGETLHAAEKEHSSLGEMGCSCGFVSQDAPRRTIDDFFDSADNNWAPCVSNFAIAGPATNLFVSQADLPWAFKEIEELERFNQKDEFKDFEEVISVARSLVILHLSTGSLPSIAPLPIEQLQSTSEHFSVHNLSSKLLKALSIDFRTELLEFLNLNEDDEKRFIAIPTRSQLSSLNRDFNGDDFEVPNQEETLERIEKTFSTYLLSALMLSKQVFETRFTLSMVASETVLKVSESFIEKLEALNFDIRPIFKMPETSSSLQSSSFEALVKMHHNHNASKVTVVSYGDFLSYKDASEINQRVFEPALKSLSSLEN